METQQNQITVITVKSVNYTYCTCQCKKCKNPLGFYTALHMHKAGGQKELQSIGHASILNINARKESI